MSSIVEMSQPSAEPVDLATAKQFLRLPATAGPDDDFISDVLIPAARRHLEGLIGLTLANRSFRQAFDGFPFYPYFSSPYAALFGAAFPFFFGYGPIASYPYPAIGGLQNQMLSPFTIRLRRSPVTAIDHIDFIGTDGQSHGLLPGKDFVVDFASIPGRISPIPGQRWPVGVSGVDTVVIFFNAGYQPPGTGSIDILDGAIWQALTSVAQDSYVFDGNKNVELQIAANAKTGATEPTWPTIIGHTVSDGSATWKNLGPVIGPWAIATAYSAPAVISDTNGNLQQLVLSSLTSGGSEPSWATTLGAITTDNTQAAWMNIGPDESEGAIAPPNQLTEFKYNIDIPPHLYTAILQLVVHWYQNRDMILTGTGSSGTHTGIPLHLQSIIDAERVLDFNAPEQ